MTFFLLLLVAGLLLAFQKRRPGFALMAAGLILFWLSGNGMITALLLRPLEGPYRRDLHPQWGGANAVVLLAGGAVRRPGEAEAQPALIAYSRMVEAVRLYRDCRAGGKACALIISGGDAAGIGESEGSAYGREALALGVPETDLVLEPRSMNTFQNAEFTSAILRSRAFDRVVLVTSALHMKRALLYFSHFNIRCEPAVADHAQALRTWLPIGPNLALADFAIHEHLGVLRYRLYERMGWNVPVPGKAGAV